MSAPTAEGLRAAADAYEAANGDGWKGSRWLRAEATRLDTASRTLGQMLAEECKWNWSDANLASRAEWERRANVIGAAIVGPTMAIVTKVDLDHLTGDPSDPTVAAALDRLWKAAVEGGPGMSDLTPESARAAAQLLDKRSVFSIDAQEQLRAEADRVEAAAKTPGQVLAESLRWSWLNLSYERRAKWEKVAAAVIAYHVGPNRVVVDQADVKQAVDACALNGYTSTAIRLREALR